MKDFEKYRPLASWLAHNPHGIHGIGHVARVFDMGARDREAAAGKGDTLDLEAVHWAAVVHDVGRLSDGIDRGHGSRSAEWVAGNQSSLPISFSADLLQKVLTCCRWHEIGDQEMPTMAQEIMCLKDADGLGRVRINDLNPAFLRSDPARLLAADVWDLYQASKSAEDPWENVLHVAADKGYFSR